LFTIDYARPQLTHYYDLGFAPPKDEPSQALVYGVPTAELVDEFEMANGTKFSWSDATMAANPYTGREPRFYATVLYNGAPWKNRTITSNVEDPVEGFVQYGAVADPRRTVTGYYAKKLLDPANNAIFTRGSVQTWKEMRYAEVLLIHAEAMAGLNNISKARESLDKVRARVQLPPTAAATQQQVIDAIEHERKVELAFEGQRYWDLRRWRKAHLVLNNTRFHGHKISTNGAGFTYETVSCDNANRQFTTQLYYFPIVNTEIQRNPSITQIKGW
jgi:hypothetical protein